MKTAVSIPDDVFEQAERLAKQTKHSRSRVFSDALREYVARHSPDEIMLAVNKACSEIGGAHNSFTTLATQRILEESDW